MKHILLAFLILLAFPVFGQNDPNSGFIEVINFDYQTDTFYVKLHIDTTNVNNIWQIGVPQKNIFNQASALSKVIVTDTMNTYPVNDTSSFIVNYLTHYCPLIEGFYYCNTDSLNDYGLIELSTDNGQTWINILADSIIPQFNAPILTGNSDGWQDFSLDFWTLSSGNGLDSFLVKFTFISDSIDTQQDGLMFDNLGFCISVNTQNQYIINNLKVFPNPTNNFLNFELETPQKNTEIRLFSTLGQEMKRIYFDNENYKQIDVSDWSSGVYFYGVLVEGVLVKQGQVLVEH